MKFPDDFPAARDQLLQRVEWTDLALRRDGRDVVAARAIQEDIEGFVARFCDRIADPHTQRMFEELEAIAADTARRLDHMRALDLFDLVIKRARWLGAEAGLDLCVSINRALAEAPPEATAAARRELIGTGPADPIAAFRARESDCDRAEAEFRKTLAKFTAVWPGALDDATRLRLANLDSADLGRWTAELRTALDARAARAAGP
jgi:hypothetical protein